MLHDLLKKAGSERVERSRVLSTPGPTRLTKVENEQIVTLYKAGKRPVDIARELGITEWTVHHRLNRNDVVRRPTGLDDAQRAEAVRLHDDGMSVAKLAEHYGKSWKTIAKELRKSRDH